MTGLREAALGAGQTRYSTGAPCARGHLAERFVANRNCVVCHTEGAQRRRDADPAKDRLRRDAWIAANLEKVTAQAKARRLANASSLSDYGRRYREENAEKTAARHARYRVECADQVRESKRLWKAKNKDAVLHHTRTRRARIKGSVCTLTQVEARAVLVAQGERCAICPSKSEMQLDHIVPIALGGDHAKYNVQWLCGPCNRRKSDRDPIVFAQLEGRLL